MFAFAVWDGEGKKLFCARDRAGEKPFYYAVAGDTFLFASELKALLLWPNLRRELNFHARSETFSPSASSLTPRPCRRACESFLRRMLSRSSSASSALRVSEPTAYWDLEFEPDDSVEDWGPAIRDCA